MTLIERTAANVSVDDHLREFTLTPLVPTSYRTPSRWHAATLGRFDAVQSGVQRRESFKPFINRGEEILEIRPDRIDIGESPRKGLVACNEPFRSDSKLAPRDRWRFT